MSMILSRDDARAYWRESGMRMEDLTAADLRSLRKRLDIETAAHGGKIAMRVKKTVRTNYVIEIRCAGHHFDNREAVTFYNHTCTNYVARFPVGFAGWADDDNIQPILRGFICWLAERQGRLRKSFFVKHQEHDGPFTFFAPSAGKAKRALVNCLIDAGDNRKFETLIRGAQAVRNYAGDIALPFRHRIAADLSREDLRVLVHAYGKTPYQEGHRNHYFTNAGDLRLLRLAWEFGLFHGPMRTFGSVFFGLTELGRRVAEGETKTYPSSG